MTLNVRSACYQHGNEGTLPSLRGSPGIDRRQVTPPGSRRSKRGPSENPEPLLTWTFWSGRPDLNRRPLDPQARIRCLPRSEGVERRASHQQKPPEEIAVNRGRSDGVGSLTSPTLARVRLWQHRERVHVRRPDHGEVATVQRGHLGQLQSLRDGATDASVFQAETATTDTSVFQADGRRTWQPGRPSAHSRWWLARRRGSRHRPAIGGTGTRPWVSVGTAGRFSYLELACGSVMNSGRMKVRTFIADR